MKIELALKEDLTDILKLQKLAYQSEARIYNDFMIPPLLQTLEQINDDFENQMFLKATVNKQIVGSVRAYKEIDTCYIGRLIVHPDFQNQGIGTSLINAIEARFCNLKRYELFTGHKSKKNLYLYQKLGYKQFRTYRIHERLQMIYLEKKGINQ